MEAIASIILGLLIVSGIGSCIHGCEQVLDTRAAKVQAEKCQRLAKECKQYRATPYECHKTLKAEECK